MITRSVIFVLAWLAVLGSCLPAWAQPIPWADLEREYQALGLPLPPADAPLVLLLREIEEVDDREGGFPGRACYATGFLLKDERPKGPAKILWGTEILELSADNLADLDVVERGRLPHQSVSVGNSEATFPINAALPAAIQCHLRGWPALGDILARRQSDRSYGAREGLFHQPRSEASVQALRYVAWAHGGNQLHEPKSNRAVIYRRMKSLSESEPGLRTAAHQDFLASLEAALQPGKGKPGDAESRIDALVDFDGGYFGDSLLIGSDNPLRQLTARAWDDMPTLLAHVDDRRITRAVLHPWDHSASRFRCVGELVSDVVQGLAGDPGQTWRRTDDGRYLVRGDVEAWWKTAQAQTEEAYAVAHVLPASSDAKEPYAELLQRLEAKSPQRLGEAYLRLLRDHPQLAAGKLVSAIGRSGLAQKEKVDLLSAGARSTRIMRRYEALDELAGLDRPAFERLLIAALQQLPAGAEKTYAECEQQYLARLCWKTNSPQVWAALLAAVRRVDVGVRMEIVDGISQGTLPPDLVKRNLGDFLVAMLDDRSIRDVGKSPEKYAYCAASQWPQMAVGDLAAYRLAERMEMDVTPYMPYLDTTTEQWSQLRKQVRERWEKDRPALPEMQPKKESSMIRQ